MQPFKRFQTDPPQRNPQEELCLLSVFYQDESARERALELCHRLSASCGHKIPLAITWWPLEKNQSPRMRRDAELAAIHADIIILAAGNHTESSGPNAILESLNACIAKRRKLHGLLAVMPANSQTSSSLTPQARNMAARAGMDFLAASPISVNATPQVLRQTLIRQLDPNRQILDQIPHAANTPRQWGLNE